MHSANSQSDGNAHADTISISAAKKAECTNHPLYPQLQLPQMYLPHCRSPTTMISRQLSTCNLYLLLNSGPTMVPTPQALVTPSPSLLSPKPTPSLKLRPNQRHPHPLMQPIPRSTNMQEITFVIHGLVASNKIGETNKTACRGFAQGSFPTTPDHPRMRITSRWIRRGRIVL